MIPDLPKGSDPSILFSQNHVSFVNDIHSSSTAKRPAARPPLMTGDQPAVANTADEGHVSCGAAYAIINHQHSGIIPVREQHAVTKQNKKMQKILPSAFPEHVACRTGRGKVNNHTAEEGTEETCGHTDNASI